MALKEPWAQAAQTQNPRRPLFAVICLHMHRSSGRPSSLTGGSKQWGRGRGTGQDGNALKTSKLSQEITVIICSI